MIASASLLIPAAKKAGIEIPKNTENPDSFKDTHYRFWLFCKCQLGRPVHWGEQWDNAQIIADLSEEELKTITKNKLEEKNFSFGPGY